MTSDLGKDFGSLISKMYFRYMWHELKAFVSYYPILVKRKKASNSASNWNWLDLESGCKVESSWKKRWRQYATMMHLIEMWAQDFSMNVSENSISQLREYLTGFIPLYDDFTDDYQLKHQEIIKTLKRNSNSSNNFQLASYLYKRIMEEHPDPDFFSDLLEKGGEAQNLSMLQKEEDVSIDQLWEITHKKGGYFTLLCFSIYSKSFSKKQWDFIYNLGAVIQLLNDTFDVYKDAKEGIKTLPNTLPNVIDIEQLFLEKVNSLLSEDIPWKVSNQNFVKRKLALVFSTGLICIEQFKEVEKKQGIFPPKILVREELICDMDSFFKVYATIKKSKALI